MKAKGERIRRGIAVAPLAALLSLVVSCAPTVRTAPERETIYLDAKSGWLSTGVHVKRGQRALFHCWGTWAVAPAAERERWPDTGPEGHGSHPGEQVHREGDSKKKLPGTPFGTLLGKVDGIVFPIVADRMVRMLAEGELFLVINDYPFYRHDNRGGLFITVAPVDD